MGCGIMLLWIRQSAKTEYQKLLITPFTETTPNRPSTRERPPRTPVLSENRSLLVPNYRNRLGMTSFYHRSRHPTFFLVFVTCVPRPFPFVASRGMLRETPSDRPPWTSSPTLNFVFVVTSQDMKRK